ncbi:MAG: VWA domain-containing protein [Candidatus Bipolaricaulota bacterium]|nr:VWA domain-containing protein [Candidatus Bipolaricaulota bacterium]
MIRFLTPWALLALLPALGVLILSLRRPTLLARALTLTLLALALAGPEVSVRQRRETVVFLVDRSASVGDEAAAVLPDLVASARERGADVGVIAFAEQATVVRWPRIGEVPGAEPPSPSGTDVAEAIDLALALAPSGPTQLVLLSDGRGTAGDALAAASRARGRGIPVHVVPVGRADLARVVEIQGPREVAGGTVVLEAILAASRPTSALVRFLRDGVELEARELTLPEGRTTASLADQPGEGFRVYRVEVQAAGDPVPENNALDWGVRVGDPAEVLVVGPRLSAADELLRAAGVPFRRASSLAPADLAGVGLVVLDGYPLGQIGARTQDALRAFVSGGGGLLVVQGRDAVRGYLGPVEELLPVTYAVPERIQEATAAVVFVLDRSASMGAMSGGALKIDLLKEAAAAAAEAMPPEDVLGAIAFDRYPYWLIRPGPVSAVREELFAALRGLTASGGTDVFPALEQAVDALRAVDARLRHAIVISDGKTHWDEAILARLRGAVAEGRIGVTTIAIGEDADLSTLAELAALGGGRTYVLASMADLRAVLVQEVERVARPRFVERETPVLPGPGAFPLSTPLPPLQGYTLTFPKPAADVALLSPAGDPLLARWRLGLGQVAVLNADLFGIWTRDWVRSPALGELWGALLGLLWGERQGVRVDWAAVGGTVRLGVEAAASGRWANGLQFTGELVGPGSSRALEFSQVGPGRYEVTIPSPGAGAYLLTVSEPGGGFGGTFALSLPYPKELEAFGPDLAALEAIARVSGGEVLRDELLPSPPGAGANWVPLGRALLWAAAGFLLLDLALRKLLA